MSQKLTVKSQPVSPSMPVYGKKKYIGVDPEVVDPMLRGARAVFRQFSHMYKTDAERVGYIRQIAGPDLLKETIVDILHFVKVEVHEAEKRGTAQSVQPQTQRATKRMRTDGGDEDEESSKRRKSEEDSVPFYRPRTGEKGKQSKAQKAENDLFGLVEGVFKEARSQTQQQKSSRWGTKTPDILFVRAEGAPPIKICGREVSFIEYKRYFGCWVDTQALRKAKWKLKEYARLYGPGIVVHSKGFVRGYPGIDGVEAFDQGEIEDFIYEIEELHSRYPTLDLSSGY